MTIKENVPLESLYKNVFQSYKETLLDPTYVIAAHCEKMGFRSAELHDISASMITTENRYELGLLLICRNVIVWASAKIPLLNQAVPLSIINWSRHVMFSNDKYMNPTDLTIISVLHLTHK